jgi:predicted metalloprotease with PDZ domain
MSKFYGTAAKVLLGLLTTGSCINYCTAQTTQVSITIQPGAEASALIEGKLTSGTADRELRFLTQFGSVTKLDQRVSGIELFSNKGETVASHLVSPGQWVAESDFIAWRYRVNITQSNDRFASAHVTWANNDSSMIALGDLLPQGLKSARVSVSVPSNWRLFPGASAENSYVFELGSVEKVVFHAGRTLRRSTFRSGGCDVELGIAGDWYFTDAEVAQIAESIVTSYSQVLGGIPARKIQIAIRPFPFEVPRGQWEADSRGSSISIMSSDMPFKSQSIQRLHEQFRHELFHLWIPNAVNLTGNYDWFYEGFALYNSLRMGVSVNRISFNDFLDTLTRAYEISDSVGNDTSLIKESENRWNGSNTAVYARGMLTAFACDLALLTTSKGKKSIANLIKTVFQENRGPSSRNGNDAVLSVLNANKELKPVVDSTIMGSSVIDWNVLLRAAGLEMETRGQNVRIKVAEHRSGRQEEVLDRLGYNNWRKVPRAGK